MNNTQIIWGVVWQSKVVLVAAGVLVILVLVARRLLHVDYDPREPPIIRHPVPYIGHLIDMFRYGSSYFSILDKKYNQSIYTLPTLTSRTYIITSAHLAGLIQRSSKTTSFYSAILEVTRRMCAFDKPTMSVIWTNVNRENGDEGLMPESHDMIAGVLGPGPTLNDTTKLQLEIFSGTLAKFDPGESGQVVDLHTWLREQFTLSNARAIYGPENLFSMHPSLINEFWNFEAGMIGLLADIMPFITARKAWLARKRVLAGLVEYIEKERYKKACNMIQKRVAINLKHGLSKEMAGHAELIMLFAVLGNAVPSTFWLLANLFARPELLAEVREEVKGAVTVTEGEPRTIHVEMLKSTAPVLVSCYRETLRMVANLSSVRWILEDTLLDGRYILKKDSICQIASGVIHSDTNVWGPDAGEFNPRRFIITPESEFVTEKEKANTATTPLPDKVPSAAFRAFGGGSVICPGRHFAQSEILGFVARMVMGFEIEKVGGGVIELPERNDGVIPLAVMKPREECRVLIRKRRGFEKVKWELEL